MDNMNSINFILIGLESDNVYELRNALHCIRLMKTLNSKNRQDLIEALEKLKKHKDDVIRQESPKIIQKLRFNYKGTRSIYT